MANEIFYPAAGSDDGYCQSSGSGFNNSDSIIYLGYIGLSTYTFIRFQNVTIPPGAVITNAFLRLTAQANDSGTPVNLNIYFHDEDDADAPVNGSEVTGASLTSAVSWNSLSAWVNGVQYDSADISSILQDIIDRSGWASGQALVIQLRDNSSSSQRRASSYEQLSGSEKAELHVQFSDVGEISDEFGIDDQVQSAGGSYEVSAPDQSGIDDQIVAQGGSQQVITSGEFDISDEINLIGEFQQLTPDQFGINDLVDAYQSVDSANGQFGISDNITGGIEYDVPCNPDDIGISDLTDALNWSEFLRQYAHLYIIKYFCTITGEADGESDIVIPIQSFQARKRDGEPTYLSVNIPGIDYFDSISDRSNGEIVVEMAYYSGSTELLKEEILRVDLENIRYDKGSNTRSVSISGHRSESFATNLVDLEDPSYKYLSEGKLRYRFPIPDPWLNPGDTAKIDSEGDEFRVDYITYIVSDNLKFMEVSEI